MNLVKDILSTSVDIISNVIIDMVVKPTDTKTPSHLSSNSEESSDDSFYCHRNLETINHNDQDETIERLARAVSRIDLNDDPIYGRSKVTEVCISSQSSECSSESFEDLVPIKQIFNAEPRYFHCKQQLLCLENRPFSCDTRGPNVCDTRGPNLCDTKDPIIQVQDINSRDTDGFQSKKSRRKGKKNKSQPLHVGNLKPEHMQQVQQVVIWDTLCLKYEALLEDCPCIMPARFDRKLFNAIRANGRLLGHDISFFDLSPQNYLDPVSTLLRAEELYQSIDMRRHDLFKQKIEKIYRRELKCCVLQVRLPGLSKGQPSLVHYDLVVLEEMRVYGVYEIVDIEGDLISFKSNKDYPDFFPKPESHLFNVSFVPNGIAFTRYHKALDRTSRMIPKSIFESSSIVVSHAPRLINVNSYYSDHNQLDKRLAKCNELQQQAIEGILGATCRPKPYILFGPPGTGKSFTLVEAVVQIYNRNTSMRILVCANSNNCADHLAADLYQTNMIRRMKRLCARSHFNRKKVKQTYDIVDKTLLGNTRIVVTTNNLSGSLVDEVKGRNFKGIQFDYVFVDEAGHAHEPETLIAASCLKPGGCLVLAGDPKQLGPVIHCKQVERLGLGRSLLERLFTFNIYARKDGQYDKEYITKLTDSYRCDPGILGLCSKLFYHNELRCLGRTPDQLLRKLNLQQPLVFHRIRGKESKLKSSFSRYNPMEIDACVDYVMQLYEIGIMPHQVGIISPYALQKESMIVKLEARIKRNLKQLNSGLTQLELNPDNEGYLDLPARGSPLQPSTDPEQESNLFELIKQSNENDRLKASSKSQQKEQRAQINKMSHDTEKALIKRWMCQVDTVDAFQGNERPIIIISTVRTPNQRGYIEGSGFLTDSKRFNVAISRAKWLAIVFGHPKVMESHENWIKFKKSAQVI